MTQPPKGAAWTPEPGAIVFLPKDEAGFTEQEIYDLLRGGAPLVAAADVHDGAMIAFIPSTSDLSRLVVEDGEPITQLHVTDTFLGPAVDIDEETQQVIIDLMKDFASKQPIIEADVFSFNVFNPEGPEPCLTAGLSGEELADAHDSIEAFFEELGYEPPEQHSPWVPHMTLVYDPDPSRYLTHSLMMEAGPITIDKVRIAFGGVITDIPLTGLSQTDE